MTETTEITCETCNYFLQHYIFWRGQYRRVGYGHCCHEDHCRQCRPEKKACPDWAEQTEEYKLEHVPMPS